MKDYLILIPPSEGKTPGGYKPSIKKFSQATQYIVDQWKSLSRSQWQKLLGVKDKALDKAISCNSDVLNSKTFPAIERYSGVVYNAIDYGTLTKAEQKRFNVHVRIVSAVFGLVAPQDLIPDYKFKISNLGVDKYWREINKKSLQGAFVIDLLPQAHKKAVEYNDGISIDFSIIKNGKKVPAGHHGKHIKGRYVRWLVQQKTLNEAVLKKFDEDGFQWQSDGYVKG